MQESNEHVEYGGRVKAELLEEYIDYQRRYRDLSKVSLWRHQFYASQFLDYIEQPLGCDLADRVTLDRIEAYVTGYAQGHNPPSIRDMCSTLRIFLRYLYHHGFVCRDFSAAVLRAPQYRLSSIPRGISEEASVRLLDSVDRSSDLGKRDYAILQILSTYGVRGSHVRRLTLDDIGWRENRITFRPTKGGKLIVQHLTATVGNSILDYLQNSRPNRTCDREIFLTYPRPARPLGRSALSSMVRNRLVSVGIEQPSGVSRGTHCFRHAFAQRMVCGAQPFKHVADMLGHKCLNSTMIYTKIDLPSMRQAALEWPEVS